MQIFHIYCKSIPVCVLSDTEVLIVIDFKNPATPHVFKLPFEDLLYNSFVFLCLWQKDYVKLEIKYIYCFNVLTLCMLSLCCQPAVAESCLKWVVLSLALVSLATTQAT